MQTGQQRAEETGEIAIRNANGRVLLHLLREPNGDVEATRTVCGRYTFSRHTGSERVDEGTAQCEVCFGRHMDNAASRRWYRRPEGS